MNHPVYAHHVGEYSEVMQEVVALLATPQAGITTLFFQVTAYGLVVRAEKLQPFLHIPGTKERRIKKVEVFISDKSCNSRVDYKDRLEAAKEAVKVIQKKLEGE